MPSYEYKRVFILFNIQLSNVKDEIGIISVWPPALT